MFRRTYNEIRELILNTALDPSVARDIVRKSGLRSGGAGGGDDGTQLGQQLYAPPPTPPSPRAPRRRVQNGLAWPYPGYVEDGNTYWDQSDTTVSNLELSQNRYNGMYFPPYSEYRIPLGVNLVDPGFGAGSGNVNPHGRASRCFVRGSTFYDPFPYPDAPMYFWADLSQGSVELYVGSYIRVGTGGEGPYQDSNPFNPPVTLPTGPVVLKTWASLDNGATWEPPSEPFSGPPLNTGAANWAFQLNPNYSPSDTEDGGAPPGTLRSELLRDDVLFKFTLLMAAADYWLEFEEIGLYIDDE